MEKRKGTPFRSKLLLAVVFAGALCAAMVFFWRRPAAADSHGNGLFSWHSFVLEENEREALFSRMKDLGLTELYQDIPEDTASDTVRSFTEAAAREGIAVYLLVGDPSWCLDRTGKDMVREVVRAASYKGVRGVMMDAEPYVIEEWDNDPNGVMECYVEAITEARKAADSKGIELIACIPHFYERLGQEEGLKRLAEEGCHAMAVMNYDKENETDNLKTEAALADTYGRPLIMIYELQAPGTHDLEENNTYYNDGLDVLASSWEALRQTYGGTGGSFTYALHYYDALLEVLDE